MKEPRVLRSYHHNAMHSSAVTLVCIEDLTFYFWTWMLSLISFVYDAEYSKNETTSSRRKLTESKVREHEEQAIRP